MSTSVEITLRAKAFKGEGVKVNRFSVAPNGTVRVWDNVAGNFTTCHSLSPKMEARIRHLVLVSVTLPNV